MKRLEVVDKYSPEIYATYDWETKTFTYSQAFFDLRGDGLHVTRGPISKTFDEIPYIFTCWLPVEGTSNHTRAMKLTRADPKDLFDVISKLYKNPPSSYFVRGVKE
ncbi:MAG: hypothetical protein H7318_14180 [Oligoflexus sp.]|nr:hypothetical protein [Oligoflexus sp.]